MTTSDTPRTDVISGYDSTHEGDTYVPRGFARKLERENNVLRERLAEKDAALVGCVEEWTDTDCVWLARVIDLSLIADWKEMRGEIERLTKERDEAYEERMQKEETGSTKLVYNKATKKIDKVNSNGLVVESFEPPIDCGD